MSGFHGLKTSETNHTGRCFWPYKKRSEPSSEVSFDKPAHMDAIVAYAKLPPNTGETEKRLSLRPSIEDSRAALRDLLQKVQLPIAKSTPDT